MAGTGKFGFSGDGGAATAAALANPSGVAVDGAGNLFIDDTDNHRIRKVDGVTKIITTVAGTGQKGSFGDGGAATAAALNWPQGVAVDGAGNLFIADANHRRIRKVDGAGIITTVAGTGQRGSFGDGGAATAAALNWPNGVAVDGAGNLFIADRYDHRIRKVDGATKIITRVAGTGQRGFSGDGRAATAAALSFPTGVAVDGAGNLFIADKSNHRIRKLVRGTPFFNEGRWIITTVAGTGQRGFSGDGGAATAAALSWPHRVAVDGAGNLFIADLGNYRIRKVDGATGIITTVAGTGKFGFSGDGGAATAAALANPSGVAVDGAGNLFIADLDNYRIRKVDGATKIITTVAGTGQRGSFGDGGAATAAALNWPYGVAVDGAGNLFIVDARNHRIRAVRGTKQP